MTARPVLPRIVTALLLASMDSRQLTAALSLTQPDVCRRLQQLHEAGIIRPVGFRRQNRRPAICYALTRRGHRWAGELIA